MKLRPDAAWAIGLSGGLGLLRGYGSPDLRIIAQLAWHTLGVSNQAAPPSEAEQLIEALKALHPDEMSPREALEALYALRAKLPKQ